MEHLKMLGALVIILKKSVLKVMEYIGMMEAGCK